MQTQFQLPRIKFSLACDQKLKYNAIKSPSVLVLAASRLLMVQLCALNANWKVISQLVRFNCNFRSSTVKYRGSVVPHLFGICLHENCPSSWFVYCQLCCKPWEHPKLKPIKKFLLKITGIFCLLYRSKNCHSSESKDHCRSWSYYNWRK